MKKIMILAGLALTLVSSIKSQAQVRFNIQIGAPVAQMGWCSNDDDYYYMPDQDVYYNVRRGGYVYNEGGNWLFGVNLPSRYGNCNYNTSRYYRIRERVPFNRNSYYREQYPIAYNGGYRGGYEQRRDGDRNGYGYRDERREAGRYDQGYRGGDRGYNQNAYNQGGYNQNGGNRNMPYNGGDRGGRNMNNNYGGGDRNYSGRGEGRNNQGGDNGGYRHGGR